MRSAIALALILVTAGCGGGTGGGEVNAPAVTTAVDIDVFGSEFAFAPPFVIVEKPGTYTIGFRNDGNVPHNLTIEGIGATDNVPPGETGVLEVTLKPGEFKMYCSLHKGEGMDGEVVVQGS